MHDVETVVAVAAAIVTDVYATTGTIGLHWTCTHSVSFVPAGGTRAVRWHFFPEAPLDQDASS
jgi:hypothetical protein